MAPQFNQYEECDATWEQQQQVAEKATNKTKVKPNLTSITNSFPNVNALRGVGEQCVALRLHPVTTNTNTGNNTMTTHLFGISLVHECSMQASVHLYQHTFYLYHSKRNSTTITDS